MPISQQCETKWNWVPAELLQNIFRNLQPDDLRKCTKTCKQWRYASIDDWLWSKLFFNHYLWFDDSPQMCDTYFEEFFYFKEQVPRKLSATIDDFEYNISYCTFSNKGTFFIVCGEQAHFCVYRSDPLEFLHERTLKESLKWKNIQAASFSPNDSMVLLNGEKLDGSGEAAVFSIDSETLEVHFMSRMCSTPSSFKACWFDDTHILVSEIYIFDTPTPLASSISQLWLCSVDRLSAESLLVPILRFLNRGGHAQSPLVGDFVSPRFRRIIQMSEQAKEEGKTLTDKVNELKTRANIDDEDVSELKQILDQRHECYHCYLQHILTEKEYGSSKDTRRLLIYVCGNVSQRVCFKMIDQKLIADALAMRRFKYKEKHGQREEQAREENTLDHVLNQFDFPDYYIDFSGSIDCINLSVDQRSLYVSVESVNINHENDEAGITHEVKIVDLEKMIVDAIGLNGKMKPIGKQFVTSNNALVASFSSERVFLWSKAHRGPNVHSVDVNSQVDCVALHPSQNLLVVTSINKALIFKP